MMSRLTCTFTKNLERAPVGTVCLDQKTDLKQPTTAQEGEKQALHVHRQTLVCIAFIEVKSPESIFGVE